MKKDHISSRKLRRRALVATLAVTAGLVGVQALAPANAGALSRAGCQEFLVSAEKAAAANDWDAVLFWFKAYNRCSQ